MIKYYQAHQIKSMDKATVDGGVPEALLIERAGRGAAEAIYRDYAPQTALIFCGKGNNGRDGLACALALFGKGVECGVVVLGDNRDEYQKMIHERGANVKIFGINDVKNLEKPQIIVDAILGIGQNRAAHGVIKEAVEAINSMGTVTVALDLPTGIDCDSGAILGCAVRCQKTYTFTAAKPCFAVYPSREYCGEVEILKVGILESGEQPAGYTLTDLAHLEKRPKRGHKGSFGRVVCFVGSEEMAGAGYFAANAAYQSGAGLVEIVTHADNKIPLSTLLPEALLTLYRQDGDLEGMVDNCLLRADSVVIGCGLGKSDAARRIVRRVARSSHLPTVYDADALNIISEEKIAIACPEKAVFTPHMKEFSRLSGYSVAEISDCPLALCREFAKSHGVTCLLKDAATVVSSEIGLFYINATGNNGMATGGSGDVLAGIAGGLLAFSCRDIPLAAATAAFIHGLAGDAAADEKGFCSLMARDILSHIPHAMTRF